jgi:crossover junction endodeoxyribonuclease RuvC
VFVLGIDPGLSRCGYCVIEARPGGPSAAALGVITTSPKTELPLRLAELQRELRELLVEFRPSSVAVERVLFQVNVRTAMSVGQASGIAMAEAAAAGCTVVQYSPNEVKQAVAGHGAADKLQVQQMVQTLLGLPALPEPPDAADAAALALTHLARLAFPTVAAWADAPGATAAPLGAGAGGGRVKNGMPRGQLRAPHQVGGRP